jgi:4-amino-4-deoxy-L-arabinose transferase-like glycosyltransferase
MLTQRMNIMKIDDMFKKIKVNRLLWFVLGALLVIILFHSLNRFFDHDELEAIHTSWKMLQEEKIYVDFFQHHHPFLYYMLIPIISILGENIHTIIAIRLIFYLMFLFILFITYLIARDNFSKGIVVIGLILLSSTYIFMIKVIEIRPNVPETLFALVSIFFLLDYFKKRNLLYLGLSAFSLGVAFLFFQLAMFLVLFIGCLLLFDVYKKTIPFLDVLAYFFVFLLALAPYGIYLVLTDSFYSYFQFNWILNMKVLNRFLPFSGLLNIYSVNTILCVFYVLGLSFYLKTSNQKRVGVLSLGLLLSVFLVRTPWPQYFMLAIPLMAITSAHTIYLIFKNNKAILFVMLVLSTGPQINWLAQGARNTNEGQLKKIAYVMSITNKDDSVYDGHILFNVFRKDINFFWYSIDPHLGTLETFQTMADYHYDIYEIIDSVKPQVISNYHIGNMEDPRIKNHYVQSKRYTDLFIRK